MIHRNAISPGTNFNSTNIPFELMFIQQIIMLIQRIMCGSIVEHGVICNRRKGSYMQYDRSESLLQKLCSIGDFLQFSLIIKS